MRRVVLLAATAVLLCGPTALAFFTGGYFDGPRAAAAAVAWALVLGLALAGPLPLPRGVHGWLAVAGLAGLALWSAISVAWAPLDGPALDGVQRLLLYLGALLAALALLRDSRAARAVEPALALGAFVVIGYGLLGRLLPGIVELSHSDTSGGRLEQPITYWNAEGLLAAMGLVLSIRVAGDRSRANRIRVAAAAACAPLATGVYLSYSRGALAVTAIGLIVLLAADATWPQLRATIAGLVSGFVAAACSAALPGVASLEGTAGEQQRDGAIMLGILLVVMLAAAIVTARAVRAERTGTARVGSFPQAGRLPAVAGAATLLCVAGLVAGGLGESADRSDAVGAGPSRLASVESLRYEYWRVGLSSFGSRPLLGEGAGAFRVVWRMERDVDEPVMQVHSLVLEKAAELGIPGLLLLGLFVGGVASAGRRALRAGAPLAPGACAACTAWLLHASIDWDWQLPAVTLPAIVLAGGLLAASERPSGYLAAPAPSGPSASVKTRSVSGSTGPRTGIRARMRPPSGGGWSPASSTTLRS
jgi:O-Antigen ligase